MENIKNHKWYALKVMPTQEMKIRDNLKAIIKNQNLEELISEVFVVEVDKELKSGKIKKKDHPDFTQYIFIRMVMNDKTYNTIKIHHVRHILGGPSSIPDDQMKQIFTHHTPSEK